MDTITPNQKVPYELTKAMKILLQNPNWRNGNNTSVD